VRSDSLASVSGPPLQALGPQSTPAHHPSGHDRSHGLLAASPSLWRAPAPAPTPAPKDSLRLACNNGSFHEVPDQRWPPTPPAILVSPLPPPPAPFVRCAPECQKPPLTIIPPPTAILTPSPATITYRSIHGQTRAAMSSFFVKTFRRAVRPGRDRLLTGVALRAAGSGMKGKARVFVWFSRLQILRLSTVAKKQNMPAKRRDNTTPKILVRHWRNWRCV
jgi:hypothetical protein